MTFAQIRLLSTTNFLHQLIVYRFGAGNRCQIICLRRCLQIQRDEKSENFNYIEKIDAAITKQKQQNLTSRTLFGSGISFPL